VAQGLGLASKVGQTVEAVLTPGDGGRPPWDPGRRRTRKKSKAELGKGKLSEGGLHAEARRSQETWPRPQEAVGR
jgi:hypothetical protein